MFPLFRAGGARCVVALAGLALSSQGLAAEPFPERLTIDQAVDEALVRSPVLRARRTAVEQAEGRLTTARTFAFNPELTVAAARRESGAGSNTDRSIRFAQEIEVGGQRRQRTEQATAERDAVRSDLLRQQRLLTARVRAAFVEALRQRAFVEVEQANAELARSLAEVARKRLESGAVAQMEVNLAQVQVGRAERDLRLTEGAYEVARTVLAEVVGLDPTGPPELDGDLTLPSRRLPPVAELLESAEEHRADLLSFRSTSSAARARIELTRRQRIPNLAIEAFHGREDGTDRLLGAELTIRIPIFNREQGRIAEARAAQRQADSDIDAGKLQVRQEVAAALARYRASHAASVSLQTQVLGTLDENLRLLQRSFEAGKTGWTEVLVFRREFVDVQRDYVDTVTAAWLAGIELDLAAGAARRAPQKEPLP